jgi:phage gp46-like protein
MPGWDRTIDPVTGDYIDDGAGGTETTMTAQTAIHHQLQGELGSWAGDDLAGSRFHTLARAKNSLRTPQVLEDMARECLRPLVAEGLISEPEIVVERDVNRIAIETTCRDLQSGEELVVTTVLPFNA